MIDLRFVKEECTFTTDIEYCYFCVYKLFLG